MTYRPTISLFGSLVLLGACSLDPKNIGTPDDGGEGTTSSGTTADGSASSTGDPTAAETAAETTAETTAATDDPTGSTTVEVDEPCTPGPDCAACSEAQAGVGPIEFKVTVTPEPGFDEPLFVDAVCVIDERMSADGQDVLMLSCADDDLPLSLKIEYGSGQLVLPDSVNVGFNVTVRYVAVENESRNYALFVRTQFDDQVILAAHRGPGLIPLIDGSVAIEDFWTPFQIQQAAAACPGTPSFCTSVVQRSALQFSVDGEDVVLLDHQVGALGSHGLHVGDVIAGLSHDNMCDGHSDDTYDFLIVNNPA